ncbi:hypothetical protein GUJ93_ZPchr0006g46073 [Zizania palustris]|uniref:Uncharacterized protein n=1 Tax=Zizania palustris TaxID=103762 RepID=A0A8J5T6L3_ZIZPA|nr:hypothetical protein GUJ93_ZPchr0006g46073 [Zizania palustris]
MEIEDTFNAQLDILLKKMDDWIMAIKGMKASAPKMTEMKIGEAPVITVEAPSQYMVVPASVEVEVTLPPAASDVADPTSAPLGSVFLTAGDVDEVIIPSTVPRSTALKIDEVVCGLHL